MTLFELAATLSLNTSGFDGKVRSAIEQGESLAGTLGEKVTAKAVAMGNALYDAARKGASALLNLGRSAVEAAAEVQAENAQFASTFGELQSAAKATFTDIWADTGIMDKRLQNVGTKAFSQFKGAGMSNPLVAMERYLRLAADAAAYYDISMEDADVRLRSFLRGNTEAGDAIGLFTSEAQRNTYALEQYGVKWQELTEAQRQNLLLNISEEIYRQSGAMGQAMRESDSWANSLANLKESWRQTLATIGGPVLMAIIPAFNKLTAWMQENPETIEKIAGFFGELASVTIDALIAGFEWISEHGSEVVAKVKAIIDNINKLIGMSGNYSFNITQTVQTVGPTAQSFVNNSDDATGIGSAVKSLFGLFSGRAVGIDYVPHNDYLARLHEGEAVLTKSEATAWRRGEVNGVVPDFTGLAETIAEVISQRPIAINIDGKTFAVLMAKEMSRSIGNRNIQTLMGMGG